MLVYTKVCKCIYTNDYHIMRYVEREDCVGVHTSVVRSFQGVCLCECGYACVSVCINWVRVNYMGMRALK